MKTVRALKPRKRATPKARVFRQSMTGGPYGGKVVWLSTGGTLPFKVTAEVEDVTYEPSDPNGLCVGPMVMVKKKVRREFKGFYNASNVWVSL